MRLRGVLLWSVVLAVAFVQVVRADDTVPAETTVPVEHTEEPALINDPPNAWEEFKAAVDVLAPTAEVIYNVEDGEWEFGTSGSVYEFTSNDIHLGRIKTGYLSTNTAYAGVDVDLPGLVTRTLAGRWTQIDSVLAVLSKYGSTGLVAGYDFEADDFVWGPTFGATLRF